jgi:hypothetical protein
MGIKQSGNGQRPSGMEEDCNGSQGPQLTVALERENSNSSDHKFCSVY